MPEESLLGVMVSNLGYYLSDKRMLGPAWGSAAFFFFLNSSSGLVTSQGPNVNPFLRLGVRFLICRGKGAVLPVPLQLYTPGTALYPSARLLRMPVTTKCGVSSQSQPSRFKQGFGFFQGQ